MNIFKCKDCGLKAKENEIVLTINQYGEEVLHCPKCNSNILELVNELVSQSPHSLKTYYELEEYDNEKQ